MEHRNAPFLKMEHPNLDREAVAESYVLGRLPEEERLAFEEHFLDCPLCIEAVETSRSLASAWKGLTREEIAAAFPPNVRRLTERGVRLAAPLLLAAALIVSVLSAAFFYFEMRRTDRELASAERTWRASREPSAARERKMAGSGATPGRSILGDVIASAPNLATVFTLEITRGSETAGTPIQVGTEPGWVVLLFERPDAPGEGSLKAELSGSDGRPAAGPVPVAPGSSDTLAAVFPSSAFAPGGYLLKIEGASGIVLARYPLRVTSSPPKPPVR
jgi:hypothetical protein